MSDADKQRWAEESARTSVEDSTEFDYETDYEADPHNYDEVYSEALDGVRRNPGDYGLEGSTGGGAAKWENYVIDSPGGSQGTNYGETIQQLTREGRLARAWRLTSRTRPRTSTR